MDKLSPRDATLERFCELARAKAIEVSGKRDLKYTNGGDLWNFPCPLEGRGHTWTGTDPQAWVTIVDGEIKCGCRKCTPKPTPNGAITEDAYQSALHAFTEEVKAAIEWDDEANVESVKFGWEELRHHDYVSVDGQFLLRHRKMKKRHGNAEPKWSFQLKLNEPDNYLNIWKSCLPTEWLAAVYPGMYQHYYNAIHVFNHQAFEACPTYRPVVCEGAKDAETFARLMTAAGVPDLIPTSLPEQKPVVLAPHQLDVFRGRETTFMPDNDQGGRDFAEKWSAVLWGVAERQKVFNAEFFGTQLIERGAKKGQEKGRDLTEWVEANAGRTDVELGRMLLEELVRTPVLLEPLARPDAWRSKLSKSTKGGARDSAANAAVVVVHHPEVTGKVRRNTRSGEVEIVDPPWGPGVVAGARAVANQLSIWLEQTDREQLHLSVRSFEDALLAVPPPYDPLAHMLAVEWDRTPRLDVLFERYLPLGVGTNLSLALSRVFMGDLVRKLRGDLAAQRLLVAIETDLPLNIADAMVGPFSVAHEGKLSEREVEHYVRAETLMVQTGMEVVAHRQTAIASLPRIFAPSVWHVPSKAFVPTPLYLAVGSEPGDDRTEAKINDKVFDYKLDGPPQLEALTIEFPQMIAEAAERIDELAAMKVPEKAKATTATSKRKLEDLRFMGDCLYKYATKEVEGVDISNPRALASAPERDEPIRHVVRERFIDVLHSHLRRMYRDQGQMEKAFNALCRSMGWLTLVMVTKRAADLLKMDLKGKPQRTLPGTLLMPDRLEKLSEFLGPSDSPPKGGEAVKVEGGAGKDGSFLPFSLFQNDLKETEGAETLEKAPVGELSSNFLEALTHKGNDSIPGIESIPHACRTRVYIESESDKRAGYLEGPEAIERVREILSKPGVVGIDFETWPTDPTWHAEQAAASAPHGQKGAAREAALLEARGNVRAHKRQACTLQLHHEDGSEVFVRLTAPAHELPVMFEPVTALMPWDDQVTLVGHNAQFECEILLKHGVAVDVECTLIAAKCLYLVAVDKDQPQPVRFGLADLIEKEFGRTRDKTIRDRNWRLEESLDEEAIEYGLQDARDSAQLWQRYERRLHDKDLFPGYQVMRDALLPTAACNLAGLPLDKPAHAALMAKLERDAAELARELDRLCGGRIDNHGSTPQVSTWITEQIIGTPIKRPTPSDIMSLTELLVSRGGLRNDAGDELRERGLHKVKVKNRLLVKAKGGCSLHEAAMIAQKEGYFDKYDSGSCVPEDALLDALAAEAAGRPVIPASRMREWQDHEAELERFEARTEKLDPGALQLAFMHRLQEGTNKAVMNWRRTETGHLAITKGSKRRKAEQLKDAFPRVSAYLIKHAQWTRATKLLDSFGKTLERWVDDDGHARGQARVFAAWTGRQSCVDPNLQNQPREEEFRALWVAKAGRKLVIADYSQIELRLAAIESGDERLREVYREGRDVHAETASIIFKLPREAIGEKSPERKQAKGVNFLSVYGGGAGKLAETVGCELGEAQEFLARFFGAYPGLAQYRLDAPQRAAASGQIEMRPNRRVGYVEGVSSPTQAINCPIQGGAASVQMRALKLTWEALRASSIDCRLAVSVHDEIILDAAAEHAAEAAKLLVGCMTRALLEIYRESEEMGLASLTAASVVDRWSERA